MYCTYCNHARIDNGQDHRRTYCLACGAVQCMESRGQCKVCVYGTLAGFSTKFSNPTRQCAYRGCTEPAIVDRAPRKKYVCRKHLSRIEVKQIMKDGTMSIVPLNDYIDFLRNANRYQTRTDETTFFHPGAQPPFPVINGFVQFPNGVL